MSGVFVTPRDRKPRPTDVQLGMEVVAPDGRVVKLDGPEFCALRVALDAAKDDVEREKLLEALFE